MRKAAKALVLSLTIFILFSIVSATAHAGDFPDNETQRARLMHYEHAGTQDLDTKLPDKDFLLLIASDTWGYFRDIVDRENALPLDNILVFKDHTNPNSYTSVTNVGLYLMCVVSAYDLKFITRQQALDRITNTIKTLDRLTTWNGLFYNYYETITLKNSGSFISSVDNGWLLAGLIVAGSAFNEVAPATDRIVKSADMGKLYDKFEGQLFLGYDVEKEKLSPYHYGTFYCEPRLASYVTIAKGDAPPQHWFKMYRSMPESWTWQSQQPAKGKEHTYENVKVQENYYQHDKFKYLPSWGGSLFEALMPTLVLKEQELGKKGLAINNKTMVDAHIWYALNEKKYKLWGMSPCAIPGVMTGYTEYGVPFLGVKGYEDLQVVTPHVSFLALSVNPKEALKNIRNFAAVPDMYGLYGFYDAYNMKNDVIATKYLCLDQAMTLISINNYLNKGAIRSRFHQASMIKAKEYLLEIEDIF